MILNWAAHGTNFLIFLAHQAYAVAGTVTAAANPSGQSACGAVFTSTAVTVALTLGLAGVQYAKSARVGSRPCSSTTCPFGTPSRTRATSSPAHQGPSHQPGRHRMPKAAAQQARRN
jgi:hypothetical protein